MGGIVCGDLMAQFHDGNWMTYVRYASKKDGSVGWRHTGNYYQTLEAAVGALYELAVERRLGDATPLEDAMRQARDIKGELIQAVREAAANGE